MQLGRIYAAIRQPGRQLRQLRRSFRRAIDTRAERPPRAPTALGRFLAEQREAWLMGSLSRMRELSQDAALTREQLTDCLPLFLEALGVGLQGEEWVRRGTNAARAHAAQRHCLGMGIEPLIREYGCIAECAVDLWTASGHVPQPEELVRLVQLSFAAAGASAAEYEAREGAARRDAALERVGFVAHELRNPLASARMATEALRAAPGKNDLIIAALESSLVLASDRIDDTLTQVRIEALATDPPDASAAVDVAELVGEAKADALLHADAKQVALTARLELGLSARGDFRVLLSALSNLVRNAVKFTREGGEVKLVSHAEEGRVLIEVHDECGGLPSQQAERIFESFTQTGSDRSGFGLGLAIAQRAVTASGGTLMVRNVAGHGCVFIMDLPAA